jgi:murein DD-endopeptidase MepM/ murein hydrolase activator NlpD
MPEILQKGNVEVILLPLLPSWLSTISHVMSAILLQNSIIIGLVVIIGILYYSRISAFFGLAGGIIGITLYRLLVPMSDSYINELVIGFNCALISLALGGLFIKLTWQTLIYTAFATVTGVFAGMAFIKIGGPPNIPALAAPFNLVTLLFLFIIRAFPRSADRRGLHAIPLELVNKPEADFNWRSFAGLSMRKQYVRLTLPFYGTWYVSNGNFSHPSHIGVAAYAWDFIIVDEYRRLFNRTGKNNEDYYCFGLPLIAPGDGTVVKVVDFIPDNTPPDINMDESWGNHVIIDHGNAEYSEISHLLQFSLKVKEGDVVKRGQLIGFCGNSGFSYSPHIHFQLQKGGSVGAQSIPAKFLKYLVHRGPGRTSISEGIPKRSERVSNPLSGI